MAFGPNSLERRARLLVDEDKLVAGQTVLYMSLHVPFRFLEREDNLVHVVQHQTRLDQIATIFYRDPQLFWVIADYQPQPIINPLAPLEQGRTIYGPSLEVLRTEILTS